ncbi:hypothetical protein Mapa_013358 [Marchantia paleacea]|nr:hypothetical protein Mapa_013358 [Marchantia paleacea]
MHPLFHSSCYRLPCVTAICMSAFSYSFHRGFSFLFFFSSGFHVHSWVDACHSPVGLTNSWSVVPRPDDFDTGPGADYLSSSAALMATALLHQLDELLLLTTERQTDGFPFFGDLAQRGHGYAHHRTPLVVL